MQAEKAISLCTFGVSGTDILTGQALIERQHHRSLISLHKKPQAQNLRLIYFKSIVRAKVL